ncbi:hypothetical protein L249_7333 [Ophiocordyceps polyrhachis-furcata BCC 54312]|uniref:Nuclear pore complex protein n=1 Tax=Ophiocordyceps polyrhachis-furcata BCC 54312 TaxID=1330021 RepID=A0A367LAJ8_9HYPO|nr:hypothetical protein L249_7333 [Ophiocordyceps polyrhachis-furcata BCC 54312]
MESKREPRNVNGIQGTSSMAKITPGPLVEAFASALDGCIVPNLSATEKRAQILDLPRKFHESAIRRLMQKRPRRSRDGNDDVDMEVDEKDNTKAKSKQQEKVKMLEKEVQLWDLVRRLLPLRYSGSQTASSLFDVTAAQSKPLQASSLDVFVDADPVIKERRAVLQWLQTTAASGPDIDELARDLQQNADRGDIIAHGWLHTRSRIKLRKNITAWPYLLDKQDPSVAASHTNSDGSLLVTHLDPDAATRQVRKLEPQDEYFERAIWLGCFEHLRRGSSLETIRGWCHERTEMWRAISMSGILLSADGKDRLTEVPPKSLVVWRRMCLSLARNGGTDDYERAVYGLLSGDIPSVEKVAKGWDDYLFAHFNALVRSQIDTFLLGLCPPELTSKLAHAFPPTDAIQFRLDLDSAEKRLIATLESQKDTRGDALEPHKALQASLIANDLDRHLYEQARILVEDASNDPQSSLLPLDPLPMRPMMRGKDDFVREKFFRLEQHEGLRIVSHVCVLISLLRQLDEKEGISRFTLKFSGTDSALENIIAAYADFLQRANQKELIPLYCTVLKPPRRYEVLSWNMIKETDASRRMTQLKIMEKLGTSVLDFARTLAKLVFAQIEKSAGHVAETKPFSIIAPGPKHELLINPVFGADKGSAEISRMDEQIIRCLEWLFLVDTAWPELLHFGVKAYKFFFESRHLLATRSLMERVQFEAILETLNEEDVDNAMLDSVIFWARYLEQSGITGEKPEQVVTNARDYRDLENLAKALDCLDDVGSAMRNMPGISPADDKPWRNLGNDIKTMKERMGPLQKGWLLTSIEAGDTELHKLRQSYLPEVILAMLVGMYVAGTNLSRDNLLESMDLAVTIAQSDSDLAKSRALATAKSDKRAAGSSSKRMRQLGWSRGLWSVKRMAGLPPDIDAASTPPAPPPKSGSHDTSRIGTPAPLPAADDSLGDGAAKPFPQSDIGPDPGPGWLPALLRDKSAQHLTELLGSPSLLDALTHAPQAAHPTLSASHADLAHALSHNAQLATQLSTLATRLSRQRFSTQAQLLSTHALERQWRQKQSDMDLALAPFSPASLYQRLAQGVHEQVAVCHALEESFLDAETETDGPASEREVADWVRRYRDAKVQLYLRQERKERWDEGRVGGWR